MVGCICHSSLCFCFCSFHIPSVQRQMKYPFQIRPDQLPRAAAFGITNQPESHLKDLQFWQTEESSYEIYYFGVLISSWNGRKWDAR